MEAVLKDAANNQFQDLIQSDSNSSNHNRVHHNPLAGLEVGQCDTEAVQHSQGQRPRQPLVEKGNLQARYWSYLFDNLHRAVEELYTTCETNESVVECQVGVQTTCCGAVLLYIPCPVGGLWSSLQEVLMSLEMCCKDFLALIQRIELQKQFEGGKRFCYQVFFSVDVLVCVSICKPRHTCVYVPITNMLFCRPPSVAWEVRKITSPSKPFTSPHIRPPQAAVKSTRPPQSGAKRCLNFRPQKQSTETCSEMQVAQAPPSNVTMTTTTQMDTKTGSSKLRTPSYSETHPQAAVPLGTHAQAAVTLDSHHQTVVPQNKPTTIASQRPSVSVAKLETKASSNINTPALSWADRVRGKVDSSKDHGISVLPGPASSTHNPLRALRGDPNNAVASIPPSNAVTKRKVAGGGDGWVLARSRSRPGRRSRRVCSGNTGEVNWAIAVPFQGARL